MAGERTFPQEEALFGRARALGGELCRSIREQRHFPDQAGYRQAFKARMQALVAYRREIWTAEHAYWLEHHGR
jgi:hypothetical protein